MQIAWKQPHKCGLSLLRRIRNPIAGLCISIGLVTSGLVSLPGLAVDLSKSTPLNSIHAVFEHRWEQSNPAILAQRALALVDGIYLYGQAQERDQLGATYLVFEVSAEQVVGAFYMPHSSFDCFQGTFQNNQLALQVVDSYEQVSYPFAIALQATTVAQSTGAATPPVTLEGFHAIETITDNDMRLLETCKADFS